MLFRCAPHAPATDHGHAATVSNGIKHLTVDIHCHIHVPAADALLNKLAPGAPPRAYGDVCDRAHLVSGHGAVG